MALWAASMTPSRATLFLAYHEAIIHSDIYRFHAEGSTRLFSLLENPVYSSFYFAACSALVGKPSTRTHQDFSTFPHAFLSSSLYKLFSLFRKKERREREWPTKKERTTTGICIDVVENVDKYLVIASNALVWTNCSFSSHVDKPTYPCEYLM